ncbi:oxidoreductase [Rhodocollybia butyracea]|uniref:3-dehydrosphinganine reductase n=1 Tax=Rhodocollybia butyracea TaxID=206335 RepID=A0A9P5U9A9_9AGAR|nr:oxidoreductase [Rhodocollybia butyracea]
MMLSFSTALTLLLSTLVLFLCSMWPAKKKWEPKGQHCYVTGGSSGLGLALAIALTKRGADVSIVARNEERLSEALAQMESYSFSLTDSESSDAALEEASKPHDGILPHAVFLCAGASRPGFFVEEDAKSLQWGMENAYWVQAYTALAYTKRIARDKTAGKIVFVASVLGYMSLIGYSSYAPGKHALRGLAETLRSELLLYDSTVHIMFPGNIDSPGFIEENRTKPRITAEIDSTSKPESPEVLAEGLIHAVQCGDFHITPDILGNIFRSSTIGATPHNNILLDGVYASIGWIGLPFWRRDVDKSVLNHRKEHQDYLEAKGFYSA